MLLTMLKIIFVHRYWHRKYISWKFGENLLISFSLQHCLQLFRKYTIFGSGETDTDIMTKLLNSVFIRSHNTFSVPPRILKQDLVLISVLCTSTCKKVKPKINFR